VETVQSFPFDISSNRIMANTDSVTKDIAFEKKRFSPKESIVTFYLLAKGFPLTMCGD
jgi:hypothetical protein